MVFDAERQIIDRVVVFLNNEEISTIGGLEAAVEDGDDVSIIPVLAGGESFTGDMVDRYSRHLIMEQVGPIGQRKIINGKVLAIGAGGLG